MDHSKNKINEPLLGGKPEPAKKTITFYNSMKEMEDDRWRYLANTSYEERLSHLEELRKQIYHDALLPDGTWPLLSRRLTIIKLDYEVCK